MKKKNRILKSQEFQELIDHGRKAVTSTLIFYYAPKKEEEARIGISVVRRIGHAVDRNRYKRQVRMMCQEEIDFASFPCDGILIIRMNYRDLDFAGNKKNFSKAVNKAIIK